MTKSSKKRLGYAILIAEFLTYFGMLIPQSYGSYIFTDIMGVDATAAASAFSMALLFRNHRQERWANSVPGFLAPVLSWGLADC